jgi:predicted nucleic acid-binding Zn ribbon protein
MAIYKYRCRGCGATKDQLARDLTLPCVCGGILRRDFMFQKGSTGLTPHFNHAVGAYVRNDREFNDALKRRSDENSATTGMDHSYARLDPGDAPTPPNAAEAVEARAKTIHDSKSTRSPINPATLTE